MAKLKLKNIGKSFGSTEVVRNVNLDIKDGEFVVFVGPSGCGKSTLLRMIAGLETATSGDIMIADARVNDVAPSKRGVAMVFQSYALYPHMTVHNNMAFGLKQARMPKDEIHRRVTEAAAVLDITDYLGRMPRALSGGQRQRVAIGRAIVREPEVFLFDEPLSNLDAALRVQTRLEIARLHQRLGATMIYVTHDQIEAMTLADRIVVLRDGKIEQVGTPTELYEKPANKFVAQFIGSPKMNFFGAGDINKTAPKPVMGKLAKATEIGIRPEHLEQCAAASSMLSARLELLEHLGEYTLAHLKTAGDTEFIAKLDPNTKAGKGDMIHFKADNGLCHYFKGDARTA